MAHLPLGFKREREKNPGTLLSQVRTGDTRASRKSEKPFSDEPEPLSLRLGREGGDQGIRSRPGNQVQHRQKPGRLVGTKVGSGMIYLRVRADRARLACRRPAQ